MARKLFFILLLIFVTGCTSQQRSTTSTTIKLKSLPNWSLALEKYDPELLKQLIDQGERQKILNFMIISLNLIDQQQYQLAKLILKDTVLEIESLYGIQDSSIAQRKKLFTEAKKARSSFYRESIKYFRGEPYERMMAYYYLGLLNLRENNFELAYASFKNGLLQDAIAEEQQYQADFKVLEALAYWTAIKMKAQSLAEIHAKALSKTQLMSLQEPHLLVLEIGQAPQKIQKGKYRELLAFSCKNKLTGTITTLLKPYNTRILKMGNLCYQAMTRGGRYVDGILASQVVWKDTWATRQKKAWKQISQHRMGSMNALVQAKTMRKSIYPEADIRSWNNIPQHIYIGTTTSTTANGLKMANNMLGFNKEINLKPMSHKNQSMISWSRL